VVAEDQLERRVAVVRSFNPSIRGRLAFAQEGYLDGRFR